MVYSKMDKLGYNDSGIEMLTSLVTIILVLKHWQVVYSYSGIEMLTSVLQCMTGGTVSLNISKLGYYDSGAEMLRREQLVCCNAAIRM